MKIEVKDLHKSFGENQVLNGISFQVQKGMALGVLGRNGAGKTTTIRIVMGVFNADSGEVLLDGAPINRSTVKIGYLPEERGLYAKRIIMEQLVYFGLLKGMNKAEAKKSADYWLDRLEMGATKNRKLDTLSKGNQQRMQLAATLIANPDIVILDEPFSGLDPVNAMLLKDIVKDLIRDGKIVLFSSHQMNYIEEFCDDIVILNGGRLVLTGNISRIKRGYDRSKIVISSLEIPKIDRFVRESLSGFVEGTTVEDSKKNTNSESDNRLVVRLRDSQSKAAFFAKLSEQKFDIDEIKVQEPSLNDIFVEYTEGRL